MLGDTTLKNYFKNSSVVDIRPVASLEFNGNDYGYPYLCGTSEPPSSNYSNHLLSLLPESGSPNISNVNRGTTTAINKSQSAQLINVVGSSKLSVASDTFHTYYTVAPNGEKYVKFHMFLKSDYKFQSKINDNSEESFSVLITASGLDSSNKLIKSEIVTENIEVNSIDWQSVTLLFANPDEDVSKVKLSIYVNPSSGRRNALLISQLSYSSISDYEVYVKNRLPLSKVFKTGRPGEFMVDMPSNLRPNIKINAENYPQQCTPVHMAMNYALGPKYENVQRSVTPFPGNPNTYYVSGTSGDSKKIWSLYKNKVKTNKIVIKTNSLAFKPSSVKVKILTDSGWSNDISPSSSIPDEHGILTLYFNGSAWTETPWDKGSYPYIEDSQVSNNIGNIMYYGSVGYVEILGIAFEGTNIIESNADFTNFGLGKRLELIEVSPRLEFDVTNFIQSVSTRQELSDDQYILSIGGISSNSMKLSLSDIPITNILTNNQSVPISNISSTSYLKNIIRKGIKGKLFYRVDRSNTIGEEGDAEYIPSFTGYLESWQESDYEISMSFYDVVKTLQSTKTVPLYLRGYKMNKIVAALFDTVGFGDFYAEELRTLLGVGQPNGPDFSMLNSDVVSHFWTTRERSIDETLLDVTKIFQVGMYTDAYGAIKFDSLNRFSEKYFRLVNDNSNASPDIYVQDFNNSNSISNLISADFVEFSKPENLIVRYITPSPSLGQSADEDASSQRIIERPFGRDEVWALEGNDSVIPYIQIADEGIKNASQKYIPYYPSQIRSLLRAIPYSSYLLIDDEIVSYDGIEYQFIFKQGSGEKRIIRNIQKPEDIQTVISEIFTEYNGKGIKYFETGRLLNVKRGLFGTPAGIHIRTKTDSISNWKMTKFTKSNNSFNNGVNVPRKSANWTETINGIKITSNSTNEMLFLYPSDTQDDSGLLKNKKRMSTQIYLGDIPNKKDGFLGVGVGLQTDGNNKLKNGLLIWVGVESGKKKQNPTIYVQEIKSDGTIQTIVSKDNFDYSEDLISEKDNIEIFLSLNKDRNRCEVLIGGTSIFQKYVKKKVDGKKKKVRQTSFSIRQLPLRSTFGVIASGYGTGVLGQMQFGVSTDPEDLNDLNISDIDDDYDGHKTKKPDRTFFIGKNTLLDNIVYGQNIAGINDSSGDNFVYTGAPVARGIKIFNIEYENYPVISKPIHVWNGYTYALSFFEEANLISIREPDDIG
jgi:hypothetical protein